MLNTDMASLSVLMCFASVLICQDQPPLRIARGSDEQFCRLPFEVMTSPEQAFEEAREKAGQLAPLRAFFLSPGTGDQGLYITSLRTYSFAKDKTHQVSTNPVPTAALLLNGNTTSPARPPRRHFPSGCAIFRLHRSVEGIRPAE